MFKGPLGASAGDRIDRFLDDHPDGALFVAVGYASVAGLAWLGERTVGRPVTLIIGNAQASRFQKATAADRGAVFEFLRRRDVEVRNWYRTGRGGRAASDAHLKVWAVLGPGGHVTAALVGSANLTRQGLFENVETCVEASDADLPALRHQITALREVAWDCRERITGYLGAKPARDGGGETRHARTAPRSSSDVGFDGSRPAAASRGRGVAKVLLFILRLVSEVLDALFSESPQQSRPGTSPSRNRSRRDDTDSWDDLSDDSDDWDDLSDDSDDWDDSSDDSDDWDDSSDDSDEWDDFSDSSSSRRRGSSRRSRSRSDDWDDSFDW